MKIDITTVIVAILSLFAAGIVIRIAFNKWVHKDTSKTVQKGNRVGGDQAGRDIYK